MFLTAHLVTIASALMALAPGTAAAAPLDRDYFGINTQYLFLGLPQDQWARHLDGMHASGIRSARFDALWWMGEPRPPVDGRHTYRWDRFDAIAASLAQRHIRWYPVISYSALWAGVERGNDKSPPADIRHYATYARALAERYGPGGAFWEAHPELPRLPVLEWEIWNEPNTSFFWHPRPDPERYADLYAAARTAIRMADPNARVIVGGLGNAPWFLPRMFAHRPDLHGNVDGVGIHPYGDTPLETIELVQQFRRQLDRELGEVDVPLMITEMGWPTEGTGPHRAVPDEQRATYMREVLDAVVRSDCGVSRIAPYTWVSPVGNPQQQGRWFGFVDTDVSPNRTGEAYVRAIEELRSHFGSRRGGRTALCDRPLTMDVTSFARPRRRGRPRRCYRADVRVLSEPAAGARVAFRYPGRTRRGKRRRAVVKTTNSRGRALACFSGSTRRKGRPSAQMRISASRADLAGVPRATAPLP